MAALSRLFGGSKKSAEPTRFEDLPAEEQEKIFADEKKARVKYHRDNVRNGPVSYKSIPAGQQRRASTRSQRALNRKVNRRHRKEFLAEQAELATLRSWLQAAGALRYTVDFTPTQVMRTRAISNLVPKYGERDKDGRLLLSEEAVVKAIEAAKADYIARVSRGRS